MLHSHQLAEKELKGHQLQEELTHEQAVTMREEAESQQIVKLKEEVSEYKADIASCIVFMVTID